MHSLALPRRVKYLTLGSKNNYQGYWYAVHALERYLARDCSDTEQSFMLRFLVFLGSDNSEKGWLPW